MRHFPPLGRSPCQATDPFVDPDGVHPVFQWRPGWSFVLCLFFDASSAALGQCALNLTCAPEQDHSSGKPVNPDINDAWAMPDPCPDAENCSQCPREAEADIIVAIDVTNGPACR